MSTQITACDPQASGWLPGRHAQAATSELAATFEESAGHAPVSGTAASASRLLGESAVMRRVLERVARVAATPTTVLVTGETGTGKELVARAAHAASPRAKRPFVRVNCGAMAEGLVASELFGHERGAFTGALERRKGRFELANGGTLFLDEVGELPPATQVALLRVLQEGEFERVGGSETLRTDARVVAATNRDLAEAVRQGRFRSDLFFRLNVFPIHLPPLRERVEDIPLLARHYASLSCRKLGRPVLEIGEAALSALTAYPWPGNVRELQNVVERAAILARGSVLRPSDLELTGSGPETARLTERRFASERQRVEQALSASRGRVYGPEGAAERLGLPPSTLESRIHRLGIDKHGFRRRCLTATGPEAA
jgi:formate hydrogenlyase transcriptional activator